MLLREGGTGGGVQLREWSLEFPSSSSIKLLVPRRGGSDGGVKLLLNTELATEPVDPFRDRFNVAAFCTDGELFLTGNKEGKVPSENSWTGEEAPTPVEVLLAGRLGNCGLTSDSVFRSTGGLETGLRWTDKFSGFLGTGGGVFVVLEAAKLTGVEAVPVLIGLVVLLVIE